MLCIASRPPPAASATRAGFGSVSARDSSSGPPQLAGLFAGGMPQLRSRGPAPPSQTDNSTPHPRRPGLYCHLITNNIFLNSCISEGRDRDIFDIS